MTKRKNVMAEAVNRYNPTRLLGYLKLADDGSVIVDRELAISSGVDRLKFACILERDYGWNFLDFDHSTIYLEADGDVVYGGVYDLRGGKRREKRVVATGPDKKTPWYAYQYGHDVLNTILLAICSVKRRNM